MSNFLNSLQRLWQNKIVKTFVLAIVLLIVIIVVIVMLIGNKSKVFDANGLINATKRYTSSNPNSLPTNEYDSRTVNISTLVSAGYLKDDEVSSCSSYVTIVKIGEEYVYTPYINCGNKFDTTLLKTKLLSSIVTEGVGLYNNNDGYIFRGETPNNHILLNNVKWRIMGLDALGNIKLIYNDIYLDYEPWDDRYNLTTDSQTGINEYINENNPSKVKEYLDNYINNNAETFTKEVKSKLTGHSVCIGKIDIKSNDINTCSNKLDNQFASLLTVNDYMNSSLDTKCNTQNIKNCQNYNFLNNNSWTITASSKDDTTVYYINKDTSILESKAYIPKAIRPIISLRNDVIYSSGSGTELDPYIIK